MKRMFLPAFFIWLMAMPFNVSAHGTDYRLIGKDAIVAAEFFYSDKTPMGYAEILIFSPENRKIEYQNGRTDQNGRFAFIAETPGDWQMKVSDGMGHAVNATVTVDTVKSELKSGDIVSDNPRNKVSKKATPLFGGASLGVRLFFGLSLMLNLFLSMYLWKRSS